MAKKSGRTINPADAHRKKERQKEIKRNKAERRRVREITSLYKDTKRIEEDIYRLQVLEEEGLIDVNGKIQLKHLQDRLSEIAKTKEGKGLDFRTELDREKKEQIRENAIKVYSKKAEEGKVIEEEFDDIPFPDGEPPEHSEELFFLLKDIPAKSLIKDSDIETALMTAVNKHQQQARVAIPTPNFFPPPTYPITNIPANPLPRFSETVPGSSIAVPPLHFSMDTTPGMHFPLARPVQPVQKISEAEAKVAKSGMIISAAPKMRNLQKELTTLVPANVIRNAKPVPRTLPTTSPHPVQSQVKRSRIIVNAAPDPEMGIPVETLNSMIPSSEKRNVAPQTSSVKSAPKGNDEEYSLFLKEMEGIL